MNFHALGRLFEFKEIPSKIVCQCKFGSAARTMGLEIRFTYLYFRVLDNLIPLRFSIHGRSSPVPSEHPRGVERRGEFVTYAVTENA